MKNPTHLIRFAALYFSLALSSFAQTGLQVQMFSIGNPYAFDKDSIFSTVERPGSKYRRMGLFNPTTKEWKYLNDSDYSNYVGPIIMKDRMNGLMNYGPGQKLYRTTD